MKKIFIGTGIVMLSLLITFVIFDLMSWYHFGDIPTKVVFIRLVIFFVIMVVTLSGTLWLVNKLKK